MSAKKRQIQDIAGKRYGRLVAEEFKHYDEKHRDCWGFRCDCGNKKIIAAANVKWGGVRSCGCLAAEHIESLNRRDIAGEKYGRLTAIRPTDRRDASGSIVWDCRCECGSIVSYSVNHLSRGKTKSCGCLYVESRSTCSENRADAIEETLLSVLVAAKNPRSDNTSGHTGVFYDKRRNTWSAYINFQKRRIYLGVFKKKEEAIQARKDAEARMHDPIIQEHWNRLSARGKEKMKLFDSDNPLDA